MIYIENRPEGDDFNQLPSRKDMVKAPTFWGFVSGLLGSGAVNVESVDWRIEAMRRREARIAALNAPAGPGVVGTIVAAVTAAVKPETKTARAVGWLARVLEHGPVAQTEVEAKGRTAGFNLKILKKAKAKLRVLSVRKGRNYWAWHLPAVRASKDEKQ